MMKRHNPDNLENDGSWIFFEVSVALSLTDEESENLVKRFNP